MQPQYQKHVLVGSRPYSFGFRRSSKFEFNLHYHPEYELTWIRRGFGTRVVGEQISPYAPGDLVLIGPNLPHTWSSSPEPAPPPGVTPHEALVFQFSEQVVNPDWLHQPEWKRVAQLLNRSRHGLFFTENDARPLYAMLDALAEQHGAALHLGLLGLLARMGGLGERARAINPLPCNAPPVAGQHAKLEEIYQYLYEHHTEELTLHRVARQFHMSPSTLHRFLKRSTFKTLVEIVNELRISQACGQLTQSERGITEICYAVGFNNLANFYRRFQALTGMAPGAYRRYFQRG